MVILLFGIRAPPPWPYYIRFCLGFQAELFQIGTCGCALVTVHTLLQQHLPLPRSGGLVVGGCAYLAGGAGRFHKIFALARKNCYSSYSAMSLS
jgi:hypothetical protein